MKNLNLVCLDGKIERFSVHLEKSEVSFILKSNAHEFPICVESRLAEICAKYLNNGSHVLISGTLTNKCIMASEIKFLPRGSK